MSDLNLVNCGKDDKGMKLSGIHLYSLFY